MRGTLLQALVQLVRRVHLSFFLMISIPFIFLGVFFAWHMATQYRNPIKLALGATVLTLYGGFIALGVSFDGENMKAIEFRLAGQLLLLFFFGYWWCFSKYCP